MKLRATALALALASLATPALAGPKDEPRQERRDDRADAAVDAATKWDKLGERWVRGRVDRDAVRVGKRWGAYRKIKLIVEHSALEMFDIVITFANGTTFSPETRVVFGKDTGSRIIDLPGDARKIRRIDFKYGNLPGGGKAQVEVWGLHE